jgi:L-alanine-DL-glutamate epimerase-like enolase superfamily enzyme
MSCITIQFDVQICVSKLLYHPLLLNFDGPSSFGYEKKQRLIGICEVIDEDGLSGFGEIYAASYLSPKLVNSFIEFITKDISKLTFESPFDFFAEFRIPFVSRGGLIETLFGGVDIALWDLFLKRHQITLSNYLGKNTLESPKLYFSSGSNFMDSSEVAQECAEIGDRFLGYKLRVGLSDASRDYARVVAASQELSQNKCLLIDAIMSTNPKPWNLSQASNMISKFLEHDPFWIEEPLHPSNLDDYKQLCMIYPDLIACGEALVSDLEFRAYEEVQLGFIQLDPTQNGGLTKTLSLLERIKKKNQKVSMHVWGSKLSFNLSYQIAQLYQCVSWVEYPSYVLETDGIMGDSSLQRDMVGFSNLCSHVCNQLAHSWSNSDGIHRV